MTSVAPRWPTTTVASQRHVPSQRSTGTITPSSASSPRQVSSGEVSVQNAEPISTCTGERVMLCRFVDSLSSSLRPIRSSTVFNVSWVTSRVNR
nr:hypothetical protein [Pseudonocardia spinosispora]